MKTVATTCPFCSCGCGLYLQGHDATLEGVAPGERHPVSAGTLCARGWAAHEAPMWGERLSEPLVRRAGELQPASWDEALSRAAQGLLAAAGAGREVGVLGSARATNEENFLAVKLARAAMATPNIDTALGWTYVPALSGFARASQIPAPSTSLDDLAASDLLVLFDGDIASTHPKLASVMLRSVSRGAGLVVFAPRRTQMARLATIHVPTRPGKELLTIERLAAAARGADAARDAAGPEINRAAGLLQRAQRPIVVVGPTLGMVEQPEALTALTSFMPRHGQDGAGVLIVPVRANLRGAVEMGVTPTHLPGLASTVDGAVRARLDSLWHRPINPGAGRSAADMLGSVAALVVVAGDPATELRSGARSVEALRALDCLVVLDAYRTETAALAEVVLPIAAPGEGTGTFTNLEGRVQSVSAARPAPGQARDGWRAVASLMADLGLPSTYGSANDIGREIRAAIPGWASAAPTGGPVPQPRTADAVPPEPPRSGPPAAPAAAAGSGFVLALEGCFDWAADPLVVNSPTLSRQHSSKTKSYPRGFADIAAADAATLGVHPGWSVTLANDAGQVTLPVVLRDDLPQGTLLVPFAFRDIVEPILGARSAVAVNVQRT